MLRAPGRSGVQPMHADLTDQCGKAVLRVRRKELSFQMKFSNGHFLGGLSNIVAGDVAVVEALDGTSNKQTGRDTPGETRSVGVRHSGDFPGPSSPAGLYSYR